MVATSDAIRVLQPTASGYVIQDDGNGSYIAYWPAELGTQPTAEQLAAVTQEQVDAAKLTKLRAEIKSIHDDNIELRVTVKLLVDELNVLRQWITDFKAATAAAASLAALKTGVAALPNTPQRTYQQAKTAIQSLIGLES